MARQARGRVVGDLCRSLVTDSDAAGITVEFRPPGITRLDRTRNAYLNLNPQRRIGDIVELRDILQSNTIHGAKFLDYLLDGEFFEGKSIWITGAQSTIDTYTEIIRHNPQLEPESPFGKFFDRQKIRVPGDNEVIITDIKDAPQAYQNAYDEYIADLDAGNLKPRVIFAGGPAAQIASLLIQMQSDYARTLDVQFLYDGGEQSNQSASAHYEHTNHANALNAEHNNSGLAILALAAKRAVFGENDPQCALDPDYHKVDLWPRGVHLRDIPLYLQNEVHGRVQRIKSKFGLMNEHDLSRVASKISTHILSYIEEVLGISLRLPKDEPRSFFFYLSNIEHFASVNEEKLLSQRSHIFPQKVSKELIEKFYGSGALANTVSADIFYENYCIRHGFDNVCLNGLRKIGGTTSSRTAIKELFFAKGHEGKTPTKCVGVKAENLLTGEKRFVPLSYLGLSLGPTATYRFSRATTWWQAVCDKLLIKQPVPHQTIATGFTSQLLFKIVDPEKYRVLPHTGLKQTHFVEIGRWDKFVVLKLTSGGNIGLPLYSRSYALGALANMFRLLTPGCGLEFQDVVCAWPGTRGINGPNNGQVVRLAENAVVRFGEGGTGMSKMGTNAQTILDMIGLKHGLNRSLSMNLDLYSHTIIDNRKIIERRLGRHHSRTSPRVVATQDGVRCCRVS
jgi:hypothetical protein